ncbi:MAG TPA: hypothetical protein DCY79_01350 [Planctomycetaceae bacterium]|nr:hypothetical protein [Planctomycetaceae bacterium]
MNVKMLLGGLVGGSIGVVIWVVAGLVGYEIGAIAWAIGGLAGIGTRMFNDQDSPLGALSATIIAATMIVVGKYLVYQLTFPPGTVFSSAFGGWDILWFVLACGTAARLAFVGEGDD